DQIRIRPPVPPASHVAIAELELVHRVQPGSQLPRLVRAPAPHRPPVAHAVTPPRRRARRLVVQPVLTPPDEIASRAAPVTPAGSVVAIVTHGSLPGGIASSRCHLPARNATAPHPIRMRRRSLPCADEPAPRAIFIPRLRPLAGLSHPTLHRAPAHSLRSPEQHLPQQIRPVRHDPV